MSKKSRVGRLVPGLVVLVCAVAGCAAQADVAAPSNDPVLIKPGVLSVCTDMPYAPFESTKGGQPVGFDVDLIGKVAAKLGLHPEILDTDFDAIQNGDALNSGKCDVEISAMTITGERARVVDFSSPYFNASQAMVVAKKSDVKSLEDLAGQKIGVQAGTTGELYATDNAPETADIVPFGDAAGMDAALAKGVVAAAVYDNTIVGAVVAGNPDLKVAAEFDTGEQYGMAVKKNANVPLLRTINGVLSELKSSGEYGKIYEKWFGKTR